jgi:hypothetical protein
MSVVVMTVGVMSVGEITVGVMTVGVMTVGVMRRPHSVISCGLCLELNFCSLSTLLSDILTILGIIWACNVFLDCFYN